MTTLISHRWRHIGFSRLDLVAVVAVLFGLGSLAFAINFRLRHPATHLRCAANLKELGTAVALYEKENNDRLPYAYIKPEHDNDRKSTVWDALIFRFIPLNSAGLAQKHLFRCPADIIARNGDRQQRSYAMPMHDMQDANWPPGPQNNTGVGLFWEAGHAGQANITNLNSAGECLESPAKRAPGCGIPAIRVSMIPAPSRTLLLTENARPMNILFSPSGATIRGPSQHVQTRYIDIENYHGGRINYLMIDGHVELLNPQDSNGQSNPALTNPANNKPDIWTIRAND
jgi:prepilin-type processing-associated H-X9-DG protein